MSKQKEGAEMMNAAASRHLQQQQQQTQQNQFAMRQQQQYHQHQQQPILYGPTTRSLSNAPASFVNSKGSSQLILNGKDLIIRILAEVFQVNQLDDGQVKWQQVSSSLVPVSLYSRTTSRWLNFLLAASSSNSLAAANTTAAMSPDSRDFLILLQQFHHQQQMNELINSSIAQTAQGDTTGGSNNLVVFQVVAHDYCDGQCKKILNVKIAQPGTRLGQASDYFVYWKEQRHLHGHDHHQHHHHSHNQQQAQVPFPQASFASINSSQQQMCPRTQFARTAGSSTTTPKSGRQTRNFNNLQHPHGITATHARQAAGGATCCQAAASSDIQQRTWGLNFASVNDAKLFYDICSLNLVDLNFNSDYLKQLASNEMRRDANSGKSQMKNMFSTPTGTILQLDPQEPQLAPISNHFVDNNNHENQKLIRDFLDYKQRRSHQSISAGCRDKSVLQQQLLQEHSLCRQRTGENLANKSQISAPSVSKCQSCKRMALEQQQQQQPQVAKPPSRGANLMDFGPLDHVATCPINFQGLDSFEGQTNAGLSRNRAQAPSKSARLRSRSSSRHQDSSLGGQQMASLDARGSKLTRSFSTPASPEREFAAEEAPETPMAATNCPVHSTGTKARHPNCGHQHPEGGTDCERPEAHHHPRCLSFMKQQQRELRSNLAKRQAPQEIPPDRPRKPARGVMRNSSSRSRDLGPTLPVRQASDRGQSVAIESGRNEGVNSAELEYFGGQTTSEPPAIENCNMRENLHTTGNTRGEFCAQQDQHLARFTNSRASQRRSTTAAVDRSTVGNFHDQFEGSSNSACSTAHRPDPASQARARYANSKNMKEFLSLDAGGQQSTTPVQFAAALNEKFQQQQAAKNQETLKQQKNSSFLTQGQQEKLDASGASVGEIGLAVPGLESISAAQVANLSPVEDEVRNVATTTDDLPLDPNTRRRMFKLTSEEVISERTEPRSLSTPTIQPANSQHLYHHHLQQQQQFSRRGNQESQIDDDRQLRAASLGPVERDSSDRSVGGRRRSLERTTCVDLVDNGLASNVNPTPTYLKKTSYRLSPIDSINGRHQQTLAKTSQPVRAGSQPRRQRTRSSGAADRNYLIRHEVNCCNPASNPFHGRHWHNELIPEPGFHLGGSELCDPLLIPSAGLYNNDQCGLTTGQPLISFKSVPDFGRLYQQQQQYQRHPVCRASQQQQDRVAEQMLQDRQYIHQILPPDSMTRKQRVNVGHKAPTMSSYAVPLCPEAEGHWAPANYGHQQSRSCPNSLRRKRRDVHEQHQFNHRHHYHHGYEAHLQGANPNPSFLYDESDIYPGPEVDSDLPGGSGAGYRCTTCSTSCSGEQQPSRGRTVVSMGEQGSLRGCSLCMMTSDFTPANYPAYASGGQVCAMRAKPLGYHPCQSSSNNRRAIEPHSMSVQQQQQNWRPCSSQSSRSPLHYGLYESDCEDIERPVEPLDTCSQVNAAARQFYGCSMDSASHGVGLDRSASAYFRPQTLRPVQGYDQTMARTALKSRQRARSQPPDLETEDTLRLNKSMENVQKLINEVQNELLLMKVGNTSGLEANAATGDRWPAAAAEQSRQTSDSRRGEIKMSIEEQCSAPTKRHNPQHPANLGGQQQQQQSRGQAVCATSATRRAGQLKCVGAIRKAGFLSVKKWILKRRQSIELARKQGWKRYWVCLRGTALLFHSVVDKRSEPLAGDGGASLMDGEKDCDLLAWIRANCCAGGQNQLLASLMASAQGENRDQFLKDMAQCYIEREPRHLIIIEGAIVQPIPEHPKRDHVFCLSTTFGDAYLFQASCQLELDNWISATHNACAASLARDLTRDEAMKLFETKVRRLELEAEKKLFLRQRLESRLTTMSSIGNLRDTVGPDSRHPNQQQQQQQHQRHKDPMAQEEVNLYDSKRATLRSLLHRLAQQLIALDNYLEQVHCEIYQLRCYLYSCSAQQTFYQNLHQTNRHQQQPPAAANSSFAACSPAFASIELPHPKSLLMHVSRQTKLLLIKLGVFTVSSFHAYLHARQGSADSILSSVQHQQQAQATTNLSFELRLRALSISERLLGGGQARGENQQLETDTEQLINLTNLRPIDVRLAKSLYRSIRGQFGGGQSATCQDQLPVVTDSDDSHSVEDGGESLIIRLKVHSSSNAASIIKQVLKILLNNPSAYNKCELIYLNYYLRFVASGQEQQAHSDAAPTQQGQIYARHDDGNADDKSSYFVVKRRETLSDLLEFDHLEMMEKIIFRVQLSRRRLDEEASPFGIAVGAQLIVGKSESQLNVHCSYIEWGSVADKAGLKDEDELLVINGVPVMDLDMMYVECIMQDEQSLNLVVRSCRSEFPPNSQPLDRSNWRPTDGGAKDSSTDDNHGTQANLPETSGGDLSGLQGGSQVISDEYISSLVCPPPPTKSNAFRRQQQQQPATTLLRHKSDMGKQALCFTKRLAPADLDNQHKQVPAAVSGQRLVSSQTSPSLAAAAEMKPSSHDCRKSQHLDLSLENLDQQTELPVTTAANGQLTDQLLLKSGHLTRLLPGQSQLDPSRDTDDATNVAEKASSSATNQPDEIGCQSTDMRRTRATEPGDNKVTLRSVPDPNCVERLRKSILELLETEYAYIRHLETISDHYMVPLEETSYLNISDLRLLSQTVIDLTSFQRDFFDKMTASIWAKCELNESLVLPSSSFISSPRMGADESEELNKIVQQLEQCKTVDHFKPLILSLARTFTSEADRFKIYAAYCVAYSKLQKFLHPKRNGNSSGFGGCYTSLAIAIPNALDTFLTSSGGSGGILASQNLTSGGSNQPREFFKPLGSFMSSNNNGINLLQSYGQSNSSSSNCGNEFGAKLRQLSEFLGNLDSSSSSASLSLPKSSNSDLTHGSVTALDQPAQSALSSTKRSPKGVGGGGSPMPPFQRSAHQQNFESYLIKPIQRIVKYPMLLNSIAASAQIYKDEELDLELQVAIKQMGSTTSYVNDAQKIHDEFGIVFELIERQFINQQQQIANEVSSMNPLARSSNSNQTSVSTTAAAASAIGLPHQPPISLTIEQLLYFGPVSWLNINEFTQNSKLKNSSNLSHVLFVFESCVVFISKEQVTNTRSNNNKRKFSTNSASTATNVINQAAERIGNNSFDSISLNHAPTISGLTSATPTYKAFPHQKSTTTSTGLATDQTSSYIIRYQSLIPVSEVQVRSVPTAAPPPASCKPSTALTNQFQWELFRCSSVNSNSSLLTKSNKRQQTDKSKDGKVYLLSSSTNEDRNAFLRKIRFIIRESVRNMSLPLARSPSSKSLTPKKMSSPSLATNTNSSCSTSLSPVCNSGSKQEMNKDHHRGSGTSEFVTAAVAANQVCDNNSFKKGIEVNN